MLQAPFDSVTNHDLNEMNVIRNLMLRHAMWTVQKYKKNILHVIRRTYTTNRTTRFNLGIQWLLCLVVTSDLNSLVNNAHIHAHAHKHMQDKYEKVPDLSHFPAKIYIEKWIQHSDRLLVFLFFLLCMYFQHNGTFFVGVFTFSQLADTTDCTLCEAPLKCRQLSQAAKWNWFSLSLNENATKKAIHWERVEKKISVCSMNIDIEFSTRLAPARRRETLLIFKPVKWIGRSVATWILSRRFQAPSNRIPCSCLFKNNRCWIENGVSIHIYSAATKIDLPIVRCAGEAVFIITTSRWNGRGRTRRTTDSRSINSRHKYTHICGMHHLLWRTRANVNIMQPYDQKTSQQKLLLRDSSGDDDFTGANHTEKKMQWLRCWQVSKRWQNITVFSIVHTLISLVQPISASIKCTNSHRWMCWKSKNFEKKNVK